MEPESTILPTTTDPPQTWEPFVKRSLLWIVLGAVLLAALRLFEPFDRDLRTVVGYVVMGVTMIAILASWTLRAPLALRTRVLAALAAVGVGVAIRNSVDVVNDGDARIVGVRFAWDEKHDQALGSLQIDSAEKSPAQSWDSTPQDFPRFLGGGVWAEVPGVEVETDWNSKPPELVWKRPIGAGWSAFAIVGQHAVTQEQRGPDELVVCYSLTTGEPEWTHADVNRFDPQEVGSGLGGIGPRATPTIHAGRVYTQGALGRLNCLDATTGKPVWSIDAVEQLHCDPLYWGNSPSPLVLPELGLVVFSIGKRQLEPPSKGSLVAVDLESGQVRWQACESTSSYASPTLATIDGQAMLLVVNEDLLTAHDPADGKLLWEHPWPGRSDSNANCSQALPLGNNQVFVSKGYGTGSSLLEIGRRGAKWQATPVWTPAVRPVLKTKFGNVVVRDGYAYGLTDVFMECAELATGKSEWKKRRKPEFGHGQLLLVGETIVVLSETGELIAVRCSPEKYQELGACEALSKEGVTWNNLALSGEYFLVRNDREAACYRVKKERAAGSRQTAGKN